MMKTMFLLFSCLISASCLYASDIQSRAAPANEQPHLKEFERYYKNGRLKEKIIVIFDNQGDEAQRITETYRKDGSRKQRNVSNAFHLLEFTKYDKQGNMLFERAYCYYYDGTLASVETRKADGERRVWTAPPPTCDTIYATHW